MSTRDTSNVIALVTYSQAARMLGVTHQTIGELSRSLGLAPKIVAWNGRAKGLDESDLAALRRALSPAEVASSS